MSDLLAHFTQWKESAQASKRTHESKHEVAARPGTAAASFETALAAQAAHAEENSLTSWDLLDIINPLQHIPVVSDIYRAATGDTIRPEIQLVGSTAIGGFVGFATGLGKMIFEAETGKSVGDAVMTAFTGSSPSSPEPVQVSMAPTTQAIPAPDVITVHDAFSGHMHPAYRAYEAQQATISQHTNELL